MKKLIKNHYLLIILSFIITKNNAQSFIQGYQDVVNQCSQSNITTNLTEFEALGLKRRGTAQLQNTLDWLKNKYLSYGYTAAQMQEDSYTYQGSPAVCKNLIVTKIGTTYPNTFVIVCGHYDSIGGTGTNDNGSGIVSILETARLLQNIPTEYSIKFINFSGEEDGLHGSQHYVSSVVNATNPKLDIKIVFNLDEVGGVAGITNNTITCERDISNNPSTNNAASAAKTNELITCVGLYTTLNTYLSYAYASDYMSFQSNNEVITGFFETNETTHKHTNTDLLVYMDPIYNYKVAKATIGATMHFATANTTSLALDNFNNEFQVSFYPNPTYDILNINKGSIIGDFTFSLIDLQGKKVFENQFTANNLLQQVDVSKFSKGLYLGVIETNGRRITKKIDIK
jgi:aminopeptidase YwaD